MTCNDAMGMLIFGVLCWTFGWFTGYLYDHHPSPEFVALFYATSALAAAAAAVLVYIAE